MATKQKKVEPWHIEKLGVFAGSLNWEDNNVFKQYLCGNRKTRRNTESVTIRKAGGLGFGRKLIDAYDLQRHSDVLLFYDSDRDMIAVKFLTEPQHGSIPVRQQGPHRFINHTGFAKEHALPCGEYRFVETTGNELFVFARSNERLAEESRRVMVDVPVDVPEDELDEVLELVAGRRI